MYWSIPGVCLTCEVVVLHYASRLPGIAAHSREMSRSLRVDLRGGSMIDRLISS